MINLFSETLSEIIENYSLSQKDFATACGIIASHVSEMKHGKRRVTHSPPASLARRSLTAGSPTATMGWKRILQSGREQEDFEQKGT